jgi:hypothetical protein
MLFSLISELSFLFVKLVSVSSSDSSFESYSEDELEDTLLLEDIITVVSSKFA